MDIRHLRYFIAVAEHRHFGRAAAMLNIAQPPLSQQIRQLEQELGTKLFNRTTRKVALTEAGELLLERGRRIVEELQTLENDVRQVGGGVQGILRVGFTGSATYGLMPQVVRHAKEELPGLALKIRGEQLTPQLVSGLLEYRLDVAVLRPPVRTAELEVSVIGKDPLVVVLPADSRLAEYEVLSLEQLEEESFVSYPSDSAVAETAIDACRQAGFYPRIVQEASETSALLSFVAAGAGVALVPATATTFAINNVVIRELADAPEVESAVAWRRGSDSALLRNFVSLIENINKKDTDS